MYDHYFWFLYQAIEMQSIGDIVYELTTKQWVSSVKKLGIHLNVVHYIFNAFKAFLTILFLLVEEKKWLVISIKTENSGWTKGKIWLVMFVDRLQFRPPLAWIQKLKQLMKTIKVMTENQAYCGFSGWLQTEKTATCQEESTQIIIKYITW